MSSIPQNISLILSEVLSDIGVNDEMVMKRRSSALIRESMSAVSYMILNRNGRVYLFGSQSEGSTTLKLYSDEDALFCEYTYHVIRDWADWIPGVTNVLMVQDETTAPGYCLLQLLRDDAPLAANCCPNNNYCMDTKGRVVLKNSMFDATFARNGVERHGPAGMIAVRECVREIDIVPAHHCKNWPIEGRRWLNRRNVGGWPCAQLKSESENSGCFLVPVDSKLSGLDELEWRISTSLAERYLMFSLNIVHMKCYVLMKMLLKSHLVFHGVISSYMCKTAVLHCIENTHSDFWQEHNLLLCLNQILRVLYNFIYYKNCPHFIIPENNLMAERISDEQQHNLLEVIQHIISSDGRALFEIRTDDVGEILQMKLRGLLVYPLHLLTPIDIRRGLSAELCYHISHGGTIIHRLLLLTIVDNTVEDAIRQFLCSYIRCYQQYPQFSYLQQKAYSCVVPLLCSTIGSLLASYYTAINRPLSDIVLPWLKLGLDSDVSSGWLKLATVYYSVGDTHGTEAILRHVDQQYDRTVVMPVCCCYDSGRLRFKQGFKNVADQIQVTDFRHIVSYCVKFMRCEINIVPQEMRQEYFRSRPEDIQYREPMIDDWMDLAVIDSLLYLYFLQYKTYGRLGNPGEQQRALHKLQQVIREEPNINHKETALNLLGQCMEQENLPRDAFHCYERSLQVRPRNNAANFHTTRLLARYTLR